MQQMDDDRSSKARQLQGLRLMRAFLRIEDASQRGMVVEVAERLARESDRKAVTPTQIEALPAGAPGDPLN